jgi:DNA mismatch repair ATPase MutS
MDNYPLLDKGKIEERLDAVEELRRKAAIRGEVRARSRR